MAASENHRATYEIIEAEKAAYLDALPPPDSDWPPDVRSVYEDIRDRLFDFGLRIEDVRTRCGQGNNNVSSRFKHFVGRAPKDYILHHRCGLAKQLLILPEVSIEQVAFALGCNSPSTLTKAFKKRVGWTPSQYRRNSRRNTGQSSS
jgi:AraC-like DNA-binding protein